MKRILLVDYAGAFHWHFHAKDQDKAWNFLKNLREIIRQVKPTRTLLLLEGGHKFRNDIYPPYKLNRKERRERQSLAEQAAYTKFKEVDMANSLKLLEACGLESVRVYGGEADDLAAWFCLNLPKEWKIINLSSDKDWYQLLQKGRIVQGSYDTKMIKHLQDQRIPTSHWFSEDAFKEEYGIPVTSWIHKKVYSGDGGDGVEGIDGVGDTIALRLVQKYGTVEEIIKHIDNIDVPRFTEKSRQWLIDNYETLYKTYKVMNLLHTPEDFITIFGESGVKQLKDIVMNLEVAPKKDISFLKEKCFEDGQIELESGLEQFVSVIA